MPTSALEGRPAFILPAAAAIGLASVAGPATAALAATVGVVVGLLGVSGRIDYGRRQRPALWVGGLAAAGVVAVALPMDLIRIPSADLAALVMWSAPPLVLGIASAARSIAHPGSNWPVGVGLLLVAGVLAPGIVVMLEHAGSPVGLDVYLSHEAAAAALAEGENPYTSAVRFLDGSPFSPPGSIHEGYAYPPITLFAYTLSDWALGDPRWVNVLSWAAVLVLVLVRSASPQRAWTFSALLVLAALPSYRLVVFAGWTEPFTIALLLGAVLLWERRWLWAAILLGLALASKQYMVLLLPLLFREWDRERARTTSVAVGVAAATLIPFVLLDPKAFFQAVVLRQAGFGFRPDSLSLPVLFDHLGAEVRIPTLLALAIALGLSWGLGRWANPAAFLARAGMVLGVFFLLTLAFTNYWFFIAALLSLGVAFQAAEGVSTPGLRSGWRETVGGTGP